LVLEVGIPIVVSRVEKSRELTCFRLNPGDVWPLVQIAPGTTQREIAQNRLAPMLHRDDVIQNVLHPRCTFWNSAIFTAAAGELADDLIDGFSHLG
jgi:hypothetical protein